MVNHGRCFFGGFVVIMCITVIGVSGIRRADVIEFDQVAALLKKQINEGQEITADVVLEGLARDFPGQAAAAEVIFTCAKAFHENGKYSYCRNWLEYLMAHYADMKAAKDAECFLPVLVLSTDSRKSGEAGLNGLIGKYGQEERLQKAVCDFARALMEHKDHAGAEQWYRYVVEHYPDAPETLQAAGGLAENAVAAREFVKADRELEQLKEVYAGDARLPKTIAEIVEYTVSPERSEAFNALRVKWYGYIVTNYPEDEIGLMVYPKLIRISYKRGLEKEGQRWFRRWSDAWGGHEDYSRRLVWMMKWMESRKERDAALYYRGVLAHDPNTIDTSKAIQGLVWGLIKENKPAEASLAVRELTETYSRAPRLCETLLKLANRCVSRQQYEPAGVMYDEVVKRWPDNQDILDLLVGQAIIDINNIQPELAEDRLAVIQQRYRDHPDYPTACRRIADAYLHNSNNFKAQKLYDAIQANWPGSEEDVLVRLSKARMAIREYKHDQVIAAVDELVSQCNGAGNGGYAVFVIGEDYYIQAVEVLKDGDAGLARDYFSQAVTIWRHNDKFDDIKHLTHACYYSAISLQKMGEYQRAIQMYQRLVENWPQYKHAAHAWIMTVECHDILRIRGQIPFDEAYEKIQEAATVLQEKYPGTIQSRIAGNWLKNSSSYRD